MFNFGFSYVGVIYLLMLFIPNIIWAKNPPEGYTSEGESKVLGIIEKIGQVLCTAIVLVFREFNIREGVWILWLVVSFVLMVLYEIYWIRYFKSAKTLEDQYKPFLGISVPGASLPVVAFLLLGIYGTNIFLIIASVFLGIGHIGIHLGHCKGLDLPKKKLGIKILNVVGCVILGLFLAVVSFFVGARNINYMKHYKLIVNGVDEGIYQELGGQEQYLLVRGADVNNPVIIFLHGGPSSPESYENYVWVDDVLEKYTVIDWDQRGCGRTYMHNIENDPNNDTASYAQALTDLDELVDYACNRFGKDKVILVGHSYGTVLASSYIEQHPEKVSDYVAIAQVISMDINNRSLASDALENAKKSGADVTALNAALANYNANSCISTTMALRQEAMGFMPTPLPENTVYLAMTSPYMGWRDFAWFMKQLQPMDDYIKLNQQLYDSLLDFDLYNIEMSENIPITYISATRDYACPHTTIEDYLAECRPNAPYILLQDSGHNIQYTLPHDVSRIVMDALD